MNWKKTLTLTAGAALIAALCGGLGYLRGVSDTNQAQFEKFKEAAAASQQAANTQANESAAASALVDKQQAASTNSINTISDEVSKRLEKQEPKIIYRTKVVNQCANDDKEPDAARPESNLTVPSDDAGSPWRFDSGTVRLLNTARLGLSVESATLGHAEGDSAASSVGVGEFASNDLQVVARYHALKIKHDALVDWVDRLKKRNLGLCVASEPLYFSHLEDP